MKIKSLALAALLTVAAAMTAAAQGAAPATGAAQSAGKRYHLDGKIVSIRAGSRQAVIDAKAIPGFMSAMAMPYTFKDSADLAKLKAGDHITADIVISGSKSWLENVKAVDDAAAGKK